MVSFVSSGLPVVVSSGFQGRSLEKTPNKNQVFVTNASS